MLSYIKQALHISKITAKKVSKCKVCGKEFNTGFERKPANTCSNECSKLYAERKVSYHYRCAYCGTAFTRAILSKRIRNYCGAKCRTSYNSAHQSDIKKEPSYWL